MKLFYDTDGNVIGSFEGATPEIEAKVGMPSNAHGLITPPQELINRLNDPMDSLHPHDLIVNGDQFTEQPKQSDVD